MQQGQLGGTEAFVQAATLMDTARSWDLRDRWARLARLRGWCTHLAETARRRRSGRGGGTRQVGKDCNRW